MQLLKKTLFFKIQHLFNFIKYLSIPKTVNWLKLVVSYLFPFFGLPPIRNIYPYFISVETTNFCNLHCPECPVGNTVSSKSIKSTFNLDLYKKLIRELKPTLQHVILYFQGEPFLHPQFMELIQYAHESHIYTSTSTNGQFLSEKIAKEIVLSGLDKLIISIDGSTQSVYETYRVGGNLQKAVNGIHHLVAWKKQMKTITPFIEIQFLVLKTNEHQMKEMQELAKSLSADRLTFKTAQLYDFENGNELLPTKNRYARYRKTKDGKYRLKGSQSNRCWRMWSGAVVNVQGEVLPCCFDKTSRFSFGSILDSSFSSCWQSRKASEFRDKIHHNRKQFEICRNCTS